MTHAMTQKTLEHCRQLDAQDPLRDLRHQFDLPDGVIYLDGNSLGVLPKATAARVAEVVTQEWGQGLIRSWNSAGWFDAPRRAGDKIARLVGAGPNEVVATDSTSINLFKVLSAALNMAREDAPQRKTIVSERSNFPTDLYIAEALCRERGCTLKLVEPEEIAGSLTADVAVLMLTHVNYRTGAMHDMAARDGRRPRRRHPHRLGSRAQCGRRARGPDRRAGGFRRGLRLQIPQWRPRRAGFCLGSSPPRRPLLATAGRLVGPRRPI